jgi:hypothetical protein
MGRENIFKELITRNILTVEQNHIQILNNVDITMYGSRAWAFTLQKIGSIKGEEYLYSLGYLMGEDTATEVMNVREKMKSYLPNILNNTENIIEITGFGIVNIYEESNKIKVKVEKNHILEYGFELYKEKSMLSHFYCGIYNAFLDVFNKKKIRLTIENTNLKPGSGVIFSQ